jgi:hypothetical protein
MKFDPILTGSKGSNGNQEGILTTKFWIRIRKKS